METNFTIVGNLTFNHFEFNESELFSHNQGLATSEEWHDLAENIQYGVMRESLSEDLFTSLCLNSEHCERMTGSVRPDKTYDLSILSMPSVAQIEARIQKELAMTFWDKMLKYVEDKTAWICIFTMLFQLLLIFFTVLNFFTSNNDNNIICVFLCLLVSMLRRTVECFCKWNIFAHLRRKRLDNEVLRVQYQPDDEVRTIHEPDPENRLNLISSVEIE